MERTIQKKYTRLEFNTLLSIIHNIMIGMNSYKQYKYIDQKILSEVENDLKIISNYYKNLTYIINSSNNNEIIITDIAYINEIFTIEHKYKKLTVDIWKKEISDGNITVLHMCDDTQNIETLFDVTTNEKYRSISCCTDKKRYWGDGRSFAIEYEIDIESFLGACETDAQLEGINYDSNYVNENCFSTVRKGLIPINAANPTYTHNYQMTLTKTPYNLLYPSTFEDITPFYCEIGLDKKFARRKRIIYYYDLNPDIEKKVIELATLLELPIEYCYKEKEKK